MFQRSAPYLIFAGCASLYLFAFVRVLMHGTDEGTLVLGAVRVARGQVPFRDFFEQMGPGTFYWLALYFKLFGVSWFATRVSLMVTTLGSMLLTYHLSRRLRTGCDTIPAILILAASFGLMWPIVSHHGDSNLFALLSFWAFVSGIDRRSRFALFLAGFGAGLTTCFLQPKGVGLFLAFLAALWFLWRKEPRFWIWVAWVSAGYLTVGAAVLSFFAATGALRDFVLMTVIWPLTTYSSVNSIPYATGLVAFYWTRWTGPLVSQLGAIAGHIVGGFLITPHLFIAVLPLLLGALALVRRKAAFSVQTIPYWIAGSALWLSEIHRKDIMHLVYGSPLLVILFFHLCRRVRILQFLAVCTAALATMNGVLVLTARTETATRRGVVRTFEEDRVLTFLNTHTQPGEDIFAYPSAPMYYFLAAANNPTRFSFLMYDQNSDSQFREVVDRLESSRVRYILWDTALEAGKTSWALPKKWAFRQKDLIMEPYLLRYYEVVAQYDTVRVLARVTESRPQVAVRRSSTAQP